MLTSFSDLHKASYEPLPWKKVGNSTKGIASRRTRSRVKTSGDAKAVADSSEVCLYRHSDYSYSCQQRGDDDETVCHSIWIQKYSDDDVKDCNRRNKNERIPLCPFAHSQCVYTTRNRKMKSSPTSNHQKWPGYSIDILFSKEPLE